MWSAEEEEEAFSCGEISLVSGWCQLLTKNKIAASVWKKKKMDVDGLVMMHYVFVLSSQMGRLLSELLQNT